MFFTKHNQTKYLRSNFLLSFFYGGEFLWLKTGEHGHVLVFLICDNLWNQQITNPRRTRWRPLVKFVIWIEQKQELQLQPIKSACEILGEISWSRTRKSYGREICNNINIDIGGGIERRVELKI